MWHRWNDPRVPRVAVGQGRRAFDVVLVRGSLEDSLGRLASLCIDNSLPLSCERTYAFENMAAARKGDGHTRQVKYGMERPRRVLDVAGHLLVVALRCWPTNYWSPYCASETVVALLVLMSLTTLERALAPSATDYGHHGWQMTPRTNHQCRQTDLHWTNELYAAEDWRPIWQFVAV